MTLVQLQTIKSIINQFYQISSASMEKLLSLLDITQLPGNQTFIQINRKNQNEYIVLKGIVRGFVNTVSGEDITLSFHTDKSIITPFSARTHDHVSTLNFQTLTTTDIAFMNALQFQELRLVDNEIREFAQKVIEKELLNKTKKEIGLATLTAKERLIQFRKDLSGLENSVPHAHIASYLGITTVSLSRLRKELAKQ
jgi:CRP-like cAMP-binding protein